VFDHVSIRAADWAASERFYATVLDAVGIERSATSGGLARWGRFLLATAGPERPPTRRLHVAFSVADRDQVDAFWRAGTAAGYRDDGAPGPRPQYAPDYYGGFLLDPDGNSAEAVHHGDEARPGTVDHLWIRVRDLTAARRFYATIAPHAGLRMVKDSDERVTFDRPDGARGTFSLLPGEPTAGLHMAFPADDHAAVRDFHAAALRAGYRDEGSPGERPAYHPGYFGGFVLDPDGNVIELVDHGR
jgi:catechol 2,3-dioxygenase-like lactoylglutathione lyase family enzyme